MKHRMIFDGARLQARLFNPGRDTLIVTFGHKPKGRTKEAVTTPLADALDESFSHLSVMTSQKDWFLNDETTDLEEAMQALSAGFFSTRTMGFSMGGYGALRFSRAMRAYFVVAVSPQISVHPSQAPYETRFPDGQKYFDPDLGCLNTHSKASIAGAIYFDPFIKQDAAHARALLEQFPNMRSFRLTGGGHPAARVLRQAGSGTDFRDLCFADAPDLAGIARLHNHKKRDTPVYWKALAGASVQRKPAVAAFAMKQHRALRQHA